MPTLYEDLLEAGVEIDSHESDLYFPVSKESEQILLRHPDQSFTIFRSQIDGSAWVDCPFAYDPWWNKRISKS